MRSKIGKEAPQPSEQRSDTHLPAGSVADPMLDRISGTLGGFRLSDILTARSHSQDFCETRANYIAQRLRFMLAFFIVAVPAWIPVDYLTLNPEHFTPMAVARGVLAGALVLIWLLALLRPRPLHIHILLFLTLLAPGLFYSAAMVIMQQGTPEPALAGYTGMPYMMVALTGLFPLTLLYGAGLMLTVLLCYAGVELWAGTLLTTASLNTLWVLSLICGITFWVQGGQLLMLLKLYRESTRDPLTGLINRRVLMARLEAEIELHQSQGRPFSVLMCDLDRFKRINDNHGHLMGDQVLRHSAEILRQQLRKTDIIARFGGEEFMVVLPGLSAGESLGAAERIRAAFENAEIQTPAGEPLPVTTSIGVTDYRDGEAVEQTLLRADELLYEAKEGGRNRVISR
ncbi:diguanylate cyclase [Motiliproteus sp. SC1-56]|uniref:GGDEF domain-containing protein n=1 Tax=Motiliproteus sp. SC1-56 TaxID=2799565 RepID=UPI001A90122E|nr:GGDEF domain-containing protein [Motiliproteus sp. SC1-56]